MQETRHVEIFTAGCGLCEEAVALVRRVACDSCQVVVRDMNRPDVAEHARRLGVGAVPAVAVDGRLSDCCAGRGIDEAALRAAGIGQPLG